ncbi:uncharacterized protein LOC141719609 [Apium graveolens]|uniref:uncharacterized protein LOC141719609 n=1 Tax=Apium graveolens TaxID=4045 RepID=UPI003D791C9E
MWVSTYLIDDGDEDEDPFRTCYLYDVHYFNKTFDYNKVRLDLPPEFAIVDISKNASMHIVSEHFIQTCNGLVTIVGMNADVIYLLNPASTQMRKLPRCNNRSFDILWLGFGFDPLSNDYNILKVVFAYLSPEDWAPENLVLEADLYSANNDCWKKVEVPQPLRGVRPAHYSKCVHAKTGMLYMEGNDEILSFNLHSEVFEVYPIHKDETLLKISNVFDFKGSLGMMFKDDVDEGSVVSLWTLDDNVSGNVYWTKKFNFEIGFNIDWIHLYLGDGQFVALNHELGVIFYDYIKKETKKFPLLTSFPGEIISIVKYTESLVSLGGFKPLNLSGG